MVYTSRTVNRANTPTVIPAQAGIQSDYDQAVYMRPVAPVTLARPDPRADRFSIPPGLQFETGPFAHQGHAVNAWCGAGYRGVLEMATGSGKTIVALLAAHRLAADHAPLLIVVAAPYVPLIQQWCDEIRPFGISPVNLTAAPGRRGRARELGRIRRQFRHSGEAQAVVVSHDTLCDSQFQAALAAFDCTTLLIADEVHNLGRNSFIADPPAFFDYRLGLSATPGRQYDQAGTEALFAFFGPVVFEFTLEEAIGTCLVEYEYHVHPVELTPEEMDTWYDLTDRIKRAMWRQEDEDDPDEYLTKLLRDRRAVLETAENKLAALQAALDREAHTADGLRYTLIYTSDKAPEQLRAVNRLLHERGVLFHQLTHEETANRQETERILRSFQEGTLRVLTAKRVLDEGVNIPQVRKAFILASTTVERQWVQRRGRLLRKCAEIGKTHSEVHDFVALPHDFDNLDRDARSLVRSELRRVQAFARLARNAGRPDGPLGILDQLVSAAFL